MILWLFFVLEGVMTYVGSRQLMRMFRD